MDKQKEFLSQFQAAPMNPLSMPCDLYDWERYIREKKIQEECENVEWEQDMGAHIPFCKLDGKICNMQCMRRFGDRN